MYIKDKKIYDILKWCGRYGLPSVSALVFTLGEILSISELAVVSAIISAIVVYLNSMLGMSNENYKEQNNE